MLIKLLPDQIAKFWDIIKYAIEQSLPPIVADSPDCMNRILSAALSNRVDVWASYQRNNGNVRLDGVGLTKTLYDDVSDTKSLLIYCLYGYTQVDRSSWPEALEVITKYAKSKGCTQLVAYSEFYNVIELARHMGADTKYTFISFDLNKTV